MPGGEQGFGRLNDKPAITAVVARKANRRASNQVFSFPYQSTATERHEHVDEEKHARFEFLQPPRTSRPAEKGKS